MPANKVRIYVALYFRRAGPSMPGQEDRYHWAIIIGPKKETPASQGRKFHAKNSILPDGTTPWRFEEIRCSLLASDMILVRVRIGKLNNVHRALSILRNTPVRGDEAGWNCVSWVKDALQRLADDSQALGTSVVEWGAVSKKALEYVRSKKDQHRFDGQAAAGAYDMTKVATWDLLEDKETIS